MSDPRVVQGQVKTADGRVRNAKIDHRRGTYTTPRKGANPPTESSLRGVKIVSPRP